MTRTLRQQIQEEIARLNGQIESAERKQTAPTSNAVQSMAAFHRRYALIHVRDKLQTRLNNLDSIAWLQSFDEGAIVKNVAKGDLIGRIESVVFHGDGTYDVLYVKEMDEDTGEFSGQQRAWFAGDCERVDDEPTEVPNCYVPGYGHMII